MPKKLRIAVRFVELVGMNAPIVPHFLVEAGPTLPPFWWLLKIAIFFSTYRPIHSLMQPGLKAKSNSVQRKSNCKPMQTSPESDLLSCGFLHLSFFKQKKH